MNGKGLSPLTSTIILLVFSIIIGVVVMTWGRSYIEQTAIPTAETTSAQSAIPLTVLQDLQERLDSGEITKEQYDKIKEVLLTQGQNK